MVLVAVIGLVEVHTQHDGDVLVLGRRGNNDALGPGLQMVRKAALWPFALCEETGRLDDDIDTELFPGKFRRLTFLEHLNGLAVDDQLSLACLDATSQPAMNTVVLEKYGQVLGIGQIIDGDDIKLSGPG